MDFDPGYGAQPFAGLCDAVPGTATYKPARYRVEWGPVFHRGRLDGTARLLGIGQDPAAHEAVARRILCGEAGHRVQGFLYRLGLTRSYVLINAYAYSVYGKGTPDPTPAMLEDRYRWIDAILAGSPIEGVVTFGGRAREVWTGYLASRQPATPPPHGPAVHPTAPIPEAQLLANWNAALQVLHPAVVTRDRPTPVLRLYGTALKPSDRKPVPAEDFPPGLPRWMREADAWAERGPSSNAALKASRITVTIPPAARLAR